MEFNETKALEIIEKHNLKIAVVRLWKSRGQIPNRYANNFKSSNTRTAIEIAVDKNVMNILCNKKLKLKAIFEDLEIPIARYNDAKRVGNKRVPLQASEVVRIVAYLKNLSQKLQYDLSIFWGQTEFLPEQRNYIEDTLVQFHINSLNVLECQAKDKIYSRFLQRRNNSAVKFENWEALEMWNKLYKLIEEIAI